MGDDQGKRRKYGHLSFNRMTALWHLVHVQKAVKQVLKVVIPAPTLLYLGVTGNEFVPLCVV